ncbi:MAG TPA: hypothetical protein VHQ65_03310 [Thermoanaerobaculia bacterium]|nr:hypothetical protein [Thermoanaerobaculia bacterium]
MHRSLMLWALAAVLITGSVPAQEPSAENPSRNKARQQMEAWHAAREAGFARRSLSAAHFVTGKQHRAELLVISTLPDPVAVELEAYRPSGERLPLGEYTVPPSQPLRVDLGELLASVVAPAPFRGSLRLSFIGDEKALAAWLVQYHGRQVLELPLQVPSSAPTSWTSFFDLPKLRPHADAFVYVLANHSTASVSYRIRLGRRNGKEERLAGTVAPGAQIVLSPRTGSLPRGFERGWLVVEHDGAPGDLVASGFLTGALAALPMLPANEILKRSYQAIRIPPADAGSSISILLFSPQKQAQVILSMVSAEGGTTTARRTVTVLPGEPEAVDIVKLFALTPAGEWRLQVTADAPIAVSGFHRSASGSVLDLAFFPDAYGHGTGSYPLPDPTTHEVFTTLVNVGSEPASVVGQIFWPGGSYALDPLEVPAGSSRRISHSEILAAATPDAVGRTIPGELRSGLFRWAATGDADLIARTEARPLSGDDVYGFNCKNCCEQMPFGVILPGDVELRAGEFVGLQAAYYYETCTGNLMGPYPITQPQVKHVPAPFSWDGSALTVEPAADDEIGFEHEVWARSEICYGFWWNIWKWVFGQACSRTFLEPWSSSTACIQQTANCSSCHQCCAAQQAFWTCKKKNGDIVRREHETCVYLCTTGPCL